MGRTTHYVARPPFVVSQESLDRNSGRQIDWDAVPESYRQGAITVAAATDAASGATTMSVDALAGTIPIDTVLYFGEAGEFARLAAEAASGATELSVDALGATIEDGDEAVYPGEGKKLIQAGKCIAERANGKIIPRANQTTTSEIATGFLETNAIEDEPSAAKTGYGIIIGGALYENLLPDADVYGASTAALPATYKTELAASTNYKVKRFAFENYRDTRS